MKRVFESNIQSSQTSVTTSHESNYEELDFQLFLKHYNIHSLVVDYFQKYPKCSTPINTLQCLSLYILNDPKEMEVIYELDRVSHLSLQNYAIHLKAQLTNREKDYETYRHLNTPYICSSQTDENDPILSSTTDIGTTTTNNNILSSERIDSSSNKKQKTTLLPTYNLLSISNLSALEPKPMSVETSTCSLFDIGGEHCLDNMQYTISLDRNINYNVDNTIKHMVDTTSTIQSPIKLPTSDGMDNSSATTSIKYKLTNLISRKASLDGWIEIDMGLTEPLLDPLESYGITTLKNSKKSVSFEIARKFTNWPDCHTKHLLQSNHYYEDGFTLIYYCAAHNGKQQGDCNCWTKIVGTRSKIHLHHYELRVYRIGEHIIHTEEKNVIPEMSLKVKNYIINGNLLNFTASRIITHMIREQKSPNVLNRNKIDFIIPTVTQIQNFKKRQKRKEQLTGQANTNLKNYIKSRICQSRNDIIDKGFNKDGEIIIVSQWEYTYKVTHQSRSGLETVTNETSMAFAYISFKYLQAYQWIYDNEVESSPAGLCMSIDFVHNLFRTKLCHGTFGMPVQVSQKSSKATASYNNKINKLVSMNSKPHHTMVPLLHTVYKSENHIDIEMSLRTIDMVYCNFITNGGSKLKVKTYMCDHSPAIALAIKHHSSCTSDILACEFHVTQGYKKNSSRIKNKTKDYMKQQLHQHNITVAETLKPLCNNRSNKSFNATAFYKKNTTRITVEENCDLINYSDDECDDKSSNDDNTSAIISISSDQLVATIKDYDTHQVLNNPIHVLKDNSSTEPKKNLTGIFHTLLFPLFKVLYYAHTLFQFDELAKIVIAIMKEKGEIKFADWFLGIYLISHWRLWFFNAGPPGHPSTNNVMESYNRSGVKSHLRNRVRQSLGDALSPKGFLEDALIYSDQYHNINVISKIPFGLSQLELLGFCSPSDFIVDQAIKILEPNNTPSNTDNLISKTPNIQKINIYDIFKLNKGIEQYIDNDENFVVLGNPERVLTRDLALQYIETLYPDDDGKIVAIRSIGESLQKLVAYLDKFRNIHLVRKEVDPLYIKDQLIRKGDILAFYTKTHNFQKLHYKRVYTQTLFKDKAFYNNITYAHGEVHYGYITNCNIGTLTVTISNNYGSSSEFPLATIVHQLVPVHKYVYTCNCKDFHDTAYSCKHVLAVMGLPDINLYRTLQMGTSNDISNVKKSGGQSKTLKAGQYCRTYNGVTILQEERLDTFHSIRIQEENILENEYLQQSSVNNFANTVNSSKNEYLESIRKTFITDSTMDFTTEDLTFDTNYEDWNELKGLAHDFDTQDFTCNEDTNFEGWEELKGLVQELEEVGTISIDDIEQYLSVTP